jgi:hypothetical protein
MQDIMRANKCLEEVSIFGMVSTNQSPVPEEIKRRL